MSDWADLGFGEDWSGWNPSDFGGMDYYTPPEIDPMAYPTMDYYTPPDFAQMALPYFTPEEIGLLMQYPEFSQMLPMPSGLSGGGGGVGGSSGGMLGSLAKALGLGNASSLLPLLASIAGGALNYNSTKNATNQMQDAITKSNEIVQSTLGGNKGLYEPFVQAGLGALPKLQNFNSNLSANFKPLGSGRGLTLGQLAGGRR